MGKLSSIMIDSRKGASSHTMGKLSSIMIDSGGVGGGGGELTHHG